MWLPATRVEDDGYASGPGPARRLGREDRMVSVEKDDVRRGLGQGRPGDGQRGRLVDGSPSIDTTLRSPVAAATRTEETLSSKAGSSAATSRRVRPLTLQVRSDDVAQRSRPHRGQQPEPSHRAPRR